MSDDLVSEISSMQTLIISVSMNLESLIKEHKKFLTTDEQDIEFEQTTMLNNLQELQNNWKLIKSKLKNEQELPPINHSFHIYFDNKMKILVKQQIKEIVQKINLHADQFGLEQIVEPSQSSPMEIEQSYQVEQNI